MVRNSLRQPPPVHENQCGTMLLNQFDQPVINFLPHFIAGDRPQLTGGNFYCEIKLALVPNIDYPRVGTSIAGEEMCHLFNRLLRSREANANWRSMRQSLQPLQRKCEVSAALVIGNRVDFI